MESHFVWWIIKSVQLRISTDALTTTILNVPSLWLIPTLLSGRAGFWKSACPVSSHGPPSNLLEIEEAWNSLLCTYRITTWIQNGTKRFLEIGIAATILFGLIISVNSSLQRETTCGNHSINYPSHWPRRGQGEENSPRGLESSIYL